MIKSWRFVLKNTFRGEYELENEPLNWSARETRLVRDMKYYGISREITSPIQFVKDGYAYVLDVFNKLGYNATVQLDIFEYVAESKRYESYFSGELIMKTIDVDSVTASVLATPSGVASLIRDKGNKEVSLETAFNIDGFLSFEVPLILVGMHSREILRRMSCTWNNEQGYNVTNGQFLQIGFDDFPVNELPGWIEERATIGSSEVFPLLKATEAGDYTFDVDFLIKVSTGPSDTLAFFYRKNNETPVAVSATFTTNYYRVVCTATVALEVGDQLFFYAVAGRTHTATLPMVSGRPGTPATDKFQVNASTTFAASAPFGLMVYEAMEQSIRKIAGNNTMLKSVALGRTDIGYAVDAPAGMNFITTGSGLATKSVDLKVSVEELYDSMRVLYNLGMDTVDEVGGATSVIIEPMAYFFTKQIGFTIDNTVGNLRKRVAQNLIYDEVKVGFDTYLSNLPGADQDPHSEVNYTITGKFINNAIDLKSKLTASSYLIEERRRDFNKPNTSNSIDNQLFIVNMKREGLGFAAAKDEAFDTVTGIDSPETMYNLDLHPSRVLKRWGAHLQSNFYRGAGLLTYGSAKTASTLSTQKADEQVPCVEGQNINSEALETALWLPELYEFECKLKSDEDRILIARKYDIIEVIDGAQKYYGYLLERTRKENNEASFTLLRANYNG